jgi:putative transcriptional regulator
LGVVAAMRDVAAVRAKTGLPQNEFARRFMLAPGTLRNWEQGIRALEGSSRLLLTIVGQVAEELLNARS